MLPSLDPFCNSYGSSTLTTNCRPATFFRRLQNVARLGDNYLSPVWTRLYNAP